MALKIVDPAVMSKVERLAKSTGLSEMAVIELAVDRLLVEIVDNSDQAARMAAPLAQIDRIPDRDDAQNPLEWDSRGQPS